MLTTTTQSVSSSSIIDVSKVELRLLNDLSKLQDFSEKLKLSESVKLIQEVRERIEKRTFSVGIVGNCNYQSRFWSLLTKSHVRVKFSLSRRYS
ncbi:hypothetical protein F7734_39655 [Scytonema sp. UIC 10036]|uniref:hypothetical protein n=1 Tax=Scytonema sp. UIC 10036 TaxID=2304196 RepID=UPI0012DA42CD|nr:hypothetical protein [Scytonema sp. UIC 10036]MUG98100.1 hypothetical protein [Scytonema sp. UIC 10036]